jgi:hypothetical protein
MIKINYRPDEQTPQIAAIYDHDDRFPLCKRSKDEVIDLAHKLKRLANALAATDKASLEAAADDIDQDIIRIRSSVISVSLVIGLPVGGELTMPSGIPI